MQYLCKQIILARTLFKRLSWIAYGCNDGERYFRKKKQNKETCDENMFRQVAIIGDERHTTHERRKVHLSKYNKDMRKLGVVAALVILKKLKLFIASYSCKLRNSE